MKDGWGNWEIWGKGMGNLGKKNGKLGDFMEGVNI